MNTAVLTSDEIVNPVHPKQSPATVSDVIHDLEQASVTKAALDIRTMLLRGGLSGALLGFATAFAFLAFDGISGGAAQLLAGAVFPVGFAIIVLLRLELVTGNFAVLTVGTLGGKTSIGETLRNWSWVYLGNLLGSIFFGFLLAVVMTQAFSLTGGYLAEKLVAVAESKTLAYQAVGGHGWATAFTKAILCNWMVAMATVLGIIVKPVPAKIIAIWLPLWTFFALGFEHAVVNLFVIPTGMLLGADIGMGQWVVWNALPVTLGNLVGGVILTGMLMRYSNRNG